MKEIYVKIYGQVQGVFYRKSTLEEACRLGVTGWVKNNLDGTVEALVQGPMASLNDIMAWFHHGPDHAVVERVVIIFEKDCTNCLEAFTILY
jgi:acylphosphatase